MPKPKKVNFEKSLDQLEALVREMESGELTLEQSLRAFENGIKLSRECQRALDEAEQKVQVLLQENGETRAADFQPDGDDEA